MDQIRLISDNQIKEINFNLGTETEAYFACSIVYKGATLVLGGQKQYNQVSADDLKRYLSTLSLSV